MGIMDRISTIVKANIHDLLDSAENPEIMLDQYIRDLESGVNEGREELVNAMADEKRLAARFEQRKRQVREWEEKAEQAVLLEKDNVARSALKAARAYQEEADATAAAWEAQKDKVAELQEQYEQIEKKLILIKGERDALLAEHQATRAKEMLTTAKISAKKATSAIKGIERMRERIEREGAKAEAREEIAAMSATVLAAEKDQADIEIEARLAELKAKITAEDE
ncbi:MAG TPA: PspA/IM30 family protein [Anaerolineae bacterium]|nr:PspA/IM30 family protein [Anaerolineae bacterium]